MHHATSLAHLALLLTPLAPSQDVKSIAPVVADPGDTVVLSGTDLAGVDDVAFTATVGGFVGQWTVHVAPVSTSATEVVVVVPDVNAFAPSSATPPGELVGSVVASSGAAASDAVPFGFLESTFGGVRTLGTPGSDPVGFAPRCAFELGGGLPQSPNPNFVATVTGLPAGGVHLFVVGRVAQAPYLPLAGGELRIDLAWYQVAFGAPVAGDPTSSRAPLAIPPGFDGARIAMQWLSLDPVTFQASLSDALVVRL
jgi:hypothetical protein